MKNRAEVVESFNEIVNMTASELETWLKSDDSKGAGWQKGNASVNAETIGHESGDKIVGILRSNPEKKPEKYTGKQVEHMRKVVAYCKRHLAQETSSNQHKPPEEVKKTKSYASLKNWGHDFLKAQRTDNSISEQTSFSASNGRRKKADNGSKISKGAELEDEEAEDKDGIEEDEQEKVEEEEQEQEQEEREQEEQVGDKRKKTRQQTGASKRRETQRGAAAEKAKQDSAGEECVEEDKEKKNAKNKGSAEITTEYGREKDADNNSNRKEAVVQGKAKKGPKHGPSKGDTVSWNWGSGHPHGKVLDVKEEKASIKTKRGNEVSREGRPEDPAIILDAGKSRAIKLAHELN